jgi:two-component system, chemotaxis family, CheB/CheR fusion protein
LITSVVMDGVLLCDADGRIREVNDALCTMTGYGREELVGATPPYPFWPHEHVEEIAKRWRAVADQGRHNFDATLRRKDGECFAVTISAAASIAEDGTPVHAAVVRDGTERAANEERLRACQERLLLTAEAAAGVVFDWDLRADRIERSPGLAELLGFRHDEADPGHQWWLGRIHPQDLPRFTATVGRVREERSGRHYSVEYRVRHKDGTYRWIQSRAVALRDDQGRAYRLVGSHADISDRRRAEDSLRALFEQSTAGIAQLDPTGRFVLANQWFCDFVGYSHEELLTVRMQEITHPDDLSHDLEVLERAKSDGRSYQVEKRYVRKDGAHVWASVSSNVVRDAEGRTQAIFGIITDITERKGAEARERAAREETERASRAKDDFLAVLSHELRTPLTPVLTTVQMMERDASLTPEQRESVEMVRRNVELEARLIDDLLDLTRISRGKLELFFAPTDVHRKVRHVAGICDSDLRSKHVALNLELNAPRHHVRADAARLQQVLWNLLKNAVKFTPQGGSITVRTQEAGSGRIRIEVSDTGCGIAPAVLPGIFDAFVQGGRAVTRRHGGLGLGLAISRKLVEMHGGTLEAFSGGVDKGSTFTLELPVTATAAREESKPTQPAGGEAPPGRTILLVEDHPDTAKTMKKLLHHSGYQVRTADSVASALRAADAQAFDLLVCDIGLPDGSGLDLMRQLLAKRPVTAIALSGYGMEDDVRRSKEAGFVDHLTKPVDVRRLQEVIRQNLT